MSIEYNVSENGTRIETFPKGALDLEDTIDYFERLKNDNTIKPGAIEIVYFNQVTNFKISYLESDKITDTYQEPKALRMIEGTIFVCETDLAYGIGRLLQVLHKIKNAEHKVVVVRSESELENLLKKGLSQA